MATVTFIPNPTLAVQIKADPGVQAFMMELGGDALDFARDHAPVDTGRLRDSLRLEHSPEGGARVSVNVEYWLFPEFGTSRMPAQPYLRPALTAAGTKLT